MEYIGSKLALLYLQIRNLQFNRSFLVRLKFLKLLLLLCYHIYANVMASDMQNFHLLYNYIFKLAKDRIVLESTWSRAPTPSSKHVKLTSNFINKFVNPAPSLSSISMEFPTISIPIISAAKSDCSERCRSSSNANLKPSAIHEKRQETT